MNHKPKVAIVLTECQVPRGGNVLAYLNKEISVPVTRIAKTEAYDAGNVSPDTKPMAKLTLRTPEDYILVREDVRTVTARMNGEAA